MALGLMPSPNRMFGVLVVGEFRVDKSGVDEFELAVYKTRESIN